MRNLRIYLCVLLPICLYKVVFPCCNLSGNNAIENKRDTINIQILSYFNKKKEVTVIYKKDTILYEKLMGRINRHPSITFIKNIVIENKNPGDSIDLQIFVGGDVRSVNYEIQYIPGNKYLIFYLGEIRRILQSNVFICSYSWNKEEIYIM